MIIVAAIDGFIGVIPAVFYARNDVFPDFIIKREREVLAIGLLGGAFAGIQLGAFLINLTAGGEREIIGERAAHIETENRIVITRAAKDARIVCEADIPLL